MKRIMSALVCSLAVLSLTGCGSENPLNSDALNALTSNINNTSAVNSSAADVIPEIPVTDAEAFKYEYNADMQGMVITDYLKESPKVRIPDKLEGEPVVGVNLSKCEKQLTQLVLPDTVIRMSLSDKTENSLQYFVMPSDGTDYNAAVKYDPDYFGRMTSDEYYEQVVESGHSDFTAYKNLIAIGVSEKSPRFSAEDGMLFYKYNGAKILLVCPQGRTESVTLSKDVTGIGRYTFYNCRKLTRVTIPDSIAEFENNIFDGCENINVTYKGKTYSYPHIGELYDLVMYGGSGMVGGMLIENDTLVKVSENAVTIEIPDTVTEISDDAFYDCSKLETIRFKNKVYTYTRSDIKDLLAAVHGEEGLTIASNNLLNKVSPELTEVVIPDRVTAIDRYAFSGCNALKKLTFGKGMTEIDCGGYGSFNLSECSNLTEVIIPEGVTSIGSYTFRYCSLLTSIAIPNGVTQIGEGTFDNCTSLSNVTIPDSVTSIATDNVVHVNVDGSGRFVPGAFHGCENIKATYKGKTYDYAHIDDLYKAINGN